MKKDNLRKIAEELKDTPIIFDVEGRKEPATPTTRELINRHFKVDDGDDSYGTFSSDKEREEYLKTQRNSLQIAEEPATDDEVTRITEFVDEEDEECEGVPWFDRNVLRAGLSKANDDTHRNFISKMLTCPDRKPALKVVDEKVFDELQAQFPNFIDVINFYKAQLRLCAITGRTRISPVLLLGPPGVGKTLFSRKLAQALKTGFTFIDMASASSSWVLSGLHATWHGAKCGKILDAMIYSPTASPVVVLDELEKPVDPQRDPKNALYQLLEESSACAFVDEFLDHPVNLSSVIYVACANGLDGISEPLLTRFKIFDIAAPSVDEQTAIIQKMYQEEVKGSSLFDTRLQQAVVDSLLGDSLRVAKQKISDAVGNALLEHTPEQLKVLGESVVSELAIELRHLKNHHKKTVTKLGF